jgi:hypothetical protein
VDLVRSGIAFDVFIAPGLITLSILLVVSLYTMGTIHRIVAGALVELDVLDRTTSG